VKLHPEWIGALVIVLGSLVAAWVWRHEYREQDRDERARKAGL
jgi:hypothetical protein